jgi:hypothetical protein
MNKYSKVGSQKIAKPTIEATPSRPPYVAKPDVAAQSDKPEAPKK